MYPASDFLLVMHARGHIAHGFCDAVAQRPKISLADFIHSAVFLNLFCNFKLYTPAAFLCE